MQRTPIHIDVQTGLMDGARYVHSPNHDARPEGIGPELIIVHGISLPPGEYGGPWIDRLFTNTLPASEHPYFAQVAALQVSSHLLIRRDGAFVQYVPFHLRAWHAGKSCYEGRERCNDFSIGIELEGIEHHAFTGPQYRALSALVRRLRARWPLRDLAAHSDVAPGRKTDPGARFDWARLLTSLAR